MTEFADAVPSEWVEDGLLIAISVRAKRRGRRLVRDALLPVATATALTFGVLSASSDRSIDVVDPPAGFAIAIPTVGTSADSKNGDIQPAVWGRLIARMRHMKRVEVARNFEDEPEPFI